MKAYLPLLLHIHYNTLRLPQLTHRVLRLWGQLEREGERGGEGDTSGS